MICGKTYAIGLLLLAALSLPLFSEDGFRITEEELAEIEQILTEQSETIESQRTTLTTLQGTLTTLSETTKNQQSTIEGLRKSSTESDVAGTIRDVIIGILLGGIAGLVIGG